MSPREENKHMRNLRKRISKAPSAPGIYKWLDKNGIVIYIGKAKNLKIRLTSYTQKPDKSAGPWKLALNKQIADFDVTVTNSELEALLLETNFIKANKPKFNVLMKDGKSFLYVQITKDPYPVIDIVRKGVARGTTGFGPYTGEMDIKQTLDMLNSIFRYKACRKSLDALNRAARSAEEIRESPLHPVFDANSKPCLEEQIGECCGLCRGKISRQEYIERINNVIRFLKGDRGQAISKLTEEMRGAAADKKFERAAKLRDTLATIEKMEEKQLVSDASGEDLDVIGIAVINGKAQVVIFKQRSGRVIDELSFTLAGEAESEAEAAAQFIPQYYSESPDIPPLVVVGGKSNIVNGFPLLERWLREKSGRAVELRCAERGKKMRLLALAEKNAHEKLKAIETKWEAAARNIETALNELKDELHLPGIPKRIECFDISHTSGTETSGSMTVAINGKAANDQYRHFAIRTLKEGEIDDYKALAEVLKRRLSHLSASVKEEEAKWKRKGVTFGMPRKKEMDSITITFEENLLADEDLLPKGFLVARKSDTIIGFARIYEHKDKTKILTVWVREDLRGNRLDQLICRKLLKKENGKKIYTLTFSNLEEHYGEIGFQYIREGPKTVERIFKDFSKDNPKSECIRMMYDTIQHRPDVSLDSKPNLIVIDGGKGQVRAAVDAMKEMELKIPVIGLAKKEEEIFIPGSSHPLSLPKDSQSVFLLMRIRNEAHRFANRLREKRAEKTMIGKPL